MKPCDPYVANKCYVVMYFLLRSESPERSVMCARNT